MAEAAALQLPLGKCVTPALMFESPRKCGLPESPKQSPPSPVAALLACTVSVVGWREMNSSVANLRVVSNPTGHGTVPVQSTP